MTDARNQFEKKQPKPHAQKLGDREHEAITQKNIITRYQNMALSTRNIKQQGNQIAELLPRIEIIQQLGNALLLADNAGADSTILHHQIKQAFSVIFELTEQLYKDLDLIAHKLINCDDDKELEAIRQHER